MKIVFKSLVMLAGLFNLHLINDLLGLQSVGSYALIVSASTILAVLLSSSIVRVYLKKMLSPNSDDPINLSFFWISELFPKFLSLVIFGITIFVDYFISIEVENLLEILLCATFFSSTQLSSQKLLFARYTNLSFFLTELRPIIFLVLIIIYGKFLGKISEGDLNFLIFVSFFIPASISYIIWMKFLIYNKRYIFKSKFINKKLLDNFISVLRDWPHFLVLMFSSRAFGNLETIIVYMVLGPGPAGMYRAAAQISNAFTIFSPIVAHSKSTEYVISVKERKKNISSKILRQASKISISGFIVLACIGICFLYIFPVYVDFKFSQDFKVLLVVLTLTQLVKVSMPLIDRFVTFAIGTYKLAMVQFLMVLSFSVISLISCHLFQLAGVAFSSFLYISSWRLYLFYVRSDFDKNYFK